MLSLLQKKIHTLSVFFSSKKPKPNIPTPFSVCFKTRLNFDDVFGYPFVWLSRKHNQWVLVVISGICWSPMHAMKVLISWETSELLLTFPSGLFSITMPSKRMSRNLTSDSLSSVRLISFQRFSLLFPWLFFFAW